MRMTDEEARARFGEQRVARLATAGPDGRPHLVPIVFAVSGDRLFSAVDAKPKRTTRLRRLANVRANPQVALLVDRYDDDWSTLWWARADGRARVVDAGEDEARRAIGLLAERYAQYRGQPPAGPVLAVTVERWSGWRAAGDRCRARQPRTA